MQQLIPWMGAAAAAIIVWAFFYGLVFPDPNMAEHLVGGGCGLAVGVLVKGILDSKFQQDDAGPQ